MRTSLRWAGGVAFIGNSVGGHTVVIDGPPEGGGRNLGPRPMELILLGLGACTCYDVVTILKKAKQDVTDVQVELDGKRADSVPSVFTDIHIRFLITGRGVNETQVDKAIRLSAEKYCSASVMLGKTANITRSFEIRETG
jgi:putative redox protein